MRGNNNDRVTYCIILCHLPTVHRQTYTDTNNAGVCVSTIVGGTSTPTTTIPASKETPTTPTAVSKETPATTTLGNTGNSSNTPTGPQASSTPHSDVQLEGKLFKEYRTHQNKKGRNYVYFILR